MQPDTIRSICGVHFIAATRPLRVDTFTPNVQAVQTFLDRRNVREPVLVEIPGRTSKDKGDDQASLMAAGDARRWYFNNQADKIARYIEGYKQDKAPWPVTQWGALHFPDLLPSSKLAAVSFAKAHLAAASGAEVFVRGLASDVSTIIPMPAIDLPGNLLRVDRKIYIVEKDNVPSSHGFHAGVSISSGRIVDHEVHLQYESPEDLALHYERIAAQKPRVSYVVYDGDDKRSLPANAIIESFNGNTWQDRTIVASTSYDVAQKAFEGAYAGKPGVMPPFESRPV